MASDKNPHEEMWRGLLTDPQSPLHADRMQFKLLPGSPRCKTCLFPLGGVLMSALSSKWGRKPSRKNPSFCNLCEEFIRTHPGGAEIDLSLLFADVRGSTSMAERMMPAEFASLMNRFFKSGSDILIGCDALIDKFVGDELIGLFLPAIVADHPAAAVEAGRRLLSATGHGEPGGPWLPIGIGVHSGTAYVGSVGDGLVADFTAMGDAVNVAARLASQAGPGELLVTEAAWTRGGPRHLPNSERTLELKGRASPIEVRALRIDGISPGS
ncbi:adenylate/guanylate cyclase domain-containing protein [Mesorhizobium sp.]|uniref:adenylate/guanylate cyclase domain-containing protein n=1 Tax=Mesorhizobium sp. TaxID=1871066 RepID=UPI000FE52976|nr:adenylate/guanylate cyclase domain-containing protein [Mesorhizobium sp.]RWB35686.1 MAG: adenylate/guanylate cyclase domain-containing protein [Mesorhizobium sp.]RWC31604.1 MAG: adenylate/guanylate cyclase domain-containing protein [Mesorhizobium sp.]RWD47615.1 MAG: adenylate/guanylate cyclase domain-containing protein [Mesorhizobium sp.]RWD75591.1 MAG: adenylate/guanylate cyclase domain-containing protein [Mesorhizobium sp.]TIS42466.1 MAG: adenylate/guanylate cyclase domain-containing prot